jgi:26S proteasome regulatory subunit N5
VQIFVEVERARITRILSDIKKQQGDLNGAADILCELQVETFGSMTRREKTEFILEQIALCIEKGDWTQAGILSRKIGTKYFVRKPKKSPEQIEKDKKAREEAEKNRSVDDPPIEKEDDVTDLKLRYYEQQITLAKHDDKYLEVCKHYRQVLDTESVENNPEQLHAVLQRIIYFVLLAPYDNEQSDLLHRINLDSRNAEIPQDAALLKQFTIPELMRWPMVEEQFSPHLCSTDIFSKSSDASDPQSFTRYEALRHRVIEHNVRVIAKYYTRITFPRLTSLLDLSEEETEKYISDLVTKKTVYARIDRPARVVSFEVKRGPDEVLDEWGSSMKALLGLLERVGHLIQREEMMARIQPGVGKEEGGKAARAR